MPDTQLLASRPIGDQVAGTPPAIASAVSVRRLGPADLGAYKQLRDEALRLHPEAFTSDHETERQRAPESYLGRLGLSEPLGGSFLLGAFAGRPGQEQLIGALGLERETRSKTRHIAWLIALMVLPVHTGRGVGSQLVARCIDQARGATGLEMIVLSVTASSERVVRLYERAGFERYGMIPRAVRIDDGKQVQYHDKAQMLLRL